MHFWTGTPLKSMVRATLRFMALASVMWVLDLIRVRILKLETPVNAAIPHKPSFGYYKAPYKPSNITIFIAILCMI